MRVVIVFIGIYLKKYYFIGILFLVFFLQIFVIIVTGSDRCLHLYPRSGSLEVCGANGSGW